MHQITSIEPKWLSEVAPTFFRVADLNKISKRKAAEKIEPLHDRFAADKDDWVSISVIPSAPNADSPTASQQGQKARLQLSSIHQWRWRPWLVACTFYQSERLSLDYQYCMYPSWDLVFRPQSLLLTRGPPAIATPSRSDTARESKADEGTAWSAKSRDSAIAASPGAVKIPATTAVFGSHRASLWSSDGNDPHNLGSPPQQPMHLHRSCNTLGAWA